MDEPGSDPDEMMTGREAAAYLRGIWERDFPPEAVDKGMACLAWRESDEPLCTRIQLIMLWVKADFVAIARRYYPMDLDI